MIKIARTTLTLGVLAGILHMPGLALAQSADARATAKDVVEEMSIWADLSGQLGQDAPSPAELDAYEPKLAWLLDEDNQKSLLCGMMSNALLGEAALQVGQPGNPDFNFEGEKRAGSLEHWLYQGAVALVPRIRPAQGLPHADAVRELTTECERFNLLEVRLSHVPMSDIDYDAEYACRDGSIPCPSYGEEDSDDDEFWDDSAGNRQR